MYAIIDVETTGGVARYERITEIAIVVHDGERVVETFSTLLNPERSIPWGITQLTGITNDMVADAPRFYEVAKRIVELTEGAIFVAHNVSFDYSFVREEFARLGYTFTRKQLCTVRMSRKTFPGLKSYSLSNLKQHFGIHADKSHRALDDTLATVEIFERILAAQRGEEYGSKVAESMLRSFVKESVRDAKLPPAVSLERLLEIPEACGVYYFHDAQGEVIYVGKSLNIRKRLFEHFADPTPKGEKLRNGVADLSYEVTGSELVALLHESAEIKRLQPPVNRTQRIKNYTGGIFTYTDQRGYRCFAVGRPSAKNKLELVADYPKLDHAKAHLETVRRQFELCSKLCNLDFHDQACFYYSIKQCRGACVSEEAVDEYNQRSEAALAALQRRLSGSFLLIDRGRTADEQAVVAVVDGVYRGYAFVSTEQEGVTPAELLDLIQPPRARDPEAGRIIRHFLDGEAKRPKVVRV